MSEDDDVKEQVRRRLLSLHRQVMEETGANATEAAREIGLDPSYPKKLENGTRASIGLGALQAIMRQTRIRSDFFLDPEIGDDPNYREFLQDGPPSHASIEAACRSIGVTLTPELFAWAKTHPDYHRATPMKVARTIRESISSPKPEQTQAKLEAKARHSNEDVPRRRRK